MLRMIYLPLHRVPRFVLIGSSFENPKDYRYMSFFRKPAGVLRGSFPQIQVMSMVIEAFHDRTRQTLGR